MTTLRQGDGGDEVARLQRLLAHVSPPGHGPGPIDGRFGPMTASSLRWFQIREGLVVDIVAGPKTWHALAKAAEGHAVADEPTVAGAALPPLPTDAPAVPHGYDGVRAAYGTFAHTPGTPAGSIDIERRWRRANIVQRILAPGALTVWCHRLVADELAELWTRACEASGYVPERVGCFAARHKMWDPTRDLSLHSWAVAIDVDPALNRYGSTATRLRRDHKSLRFVEVFEGAGWGWAGRWKRPDDMHLQRATGC